MCQSLFQGHSTEKRKEKKKRNNPGSQELKLKEPIIKYDWQNKITIENNKYSTCEVNLYFTKDGQERPH